MDGAILGFVLGIMFMAFWAFGPLPMFTFAEIEKCRDHQEWCAVEMPRLYKTMGYPTQPEESNNG